MTEDEVNNNDFDDYQHPTVASIFHAKPTKEKLKIVLSNKKFLRIQPLIVMWITAGRACVCV